jgi:hypothetical protein
MPPDRYRSYVIRVRRTGAVGHGAGGSATRLDVEDLLDGGRATVSGDPARSLADSLERLVDPERAAAPAGDADPSMPAEGSSP